ncbi:hypothetical protein DPEC_G00291600 [Dallia pectoralis]|uniref:Uncharacterized protein n=1 Tax=Dallia pectoralis TaxID=75939 RepID=A0ACC2FHN4_DALPE|nr:hypothetical protein DPEC_G00291600 [Dallia pectoralis]
MLRERMGMCAIMKSLHIARDNINPALISPEPPRVPLSGVFLCLFGTLSTPTCLFPDEVANATVTSVFLGRRRRRRGARLPERENPASAERARRRKKTSEIGGEKRNAT